MITYKKYQIIAESVEPYTGEKLTGGEFIAEFMRPIFGNKINAIEVMYAIYLDNSLTPLAIQLIGQGGISACLVDVKLIFKGAVNSCCTQVVMIHNHPSGNLNVSDQDILITNKVNEGLKTLDLRLTDHVILTEDSYTSMRDKGYSCFN